jgi:hypothetical protein
VNQMTYFKATRLFQQNTPIVPITQCHQHERTQQYHAQTLRFPNDTTNTRPYCVMRVVEER